MVSAMVFSVLLPLCASQVAVTRNVAIIPNNFFSILPPPFNRSPPGDPFNTTFWQTIVSSTAVQDEINKLANATFIAFTTEFASMIASDAKVERVAVLPSDDNFVTEGPVWIPDRGELFFFPLLRDHQYLYNPTTQNLSVVNANPPILSANGATLHNGTIFLATVGDDETHPPALVALDPRTFQSNAILNNYRGVHFNGIDDLIVTTEGSFFFTDLGFGAPLPAQLGRWTYMYNPLSGEIRLLDDSLVAPNGLALSPDESILYIGDTGSFLTDDNTSTRTIYAYNVNNGRSLSNRTAFHLTDSGGPDGVKVASSGHVLTVGEFVGATASSVDVISSSGELIGKINIPNICNNLAFGGENLDVLFVTCFGELWQVTGLGLTGISRP
ncbi:calcium-dependent phosphotriesterase [Atractiella rhizophila]|nr:calcium-dependent phosphotriesterase [Atractiella rhizophila]